MTSREKKQHLPTCPKQTQEFDEKLRKMHAAQVEQYNRDPRTIPQSKSGSTKKYAFEACVYDIHNQPTPVPIKKQRLAALEVMQVHYSELEIAVRQGLGTCVYNATISCVPLGSVTTAIAEYEAKALESSRSKLEAQCRALEQLQSSALKLHKSMIEDFKGLVEATKTTQFYKGLSAEVKDAANKMALETETRMKNYTTFPTNAQESLLRAQTLLGQIK